MREYLYRLIGREISRITRRYDATIEWRAHAPRSRDLLAYVDSPAKSRCDGEAFTPDLSAERERRTAVLLNGELNHCPDVQGMLDSLKPRLSRASRVVLVLYNPYLSWLYKLANLLGLRSGEVPVTFLTRGDLESFARLSGYDIVRTRLTGYLPWRLFGLGTLANRLMSVMPLARWLALVYIAVLRPVVDESARRPALSVVIPARNERGNIRAAVERMPDLGCNIEVIFVEGHSTDGTWEEIQALVADYRGPLRLKSLKQGGRGKSDAVLAGFAAAEGELLTVLDADLTMPPEMLPRFYMAWVGGQADFINGSRLVYPIHPEAMQFLNRLGNVFFAKALSWALDNRYSDSLCGTKMMARHDHLRMLAWRREFGEFDPFGDFDMLFPAAELALGTIDVPIRYLPRTYGETNIRRFYHGLMLLKMTLVGLWRVKLGLRA